jgi:hypothetical protein
VLHDLQGLGSLTTIWLHLSDAWDNALDVTVDEMIIIILLKDLSF